MATPTITPETLLSTEGYFDVGVDTSGEVPEYTRDPKALPRRLVEPSLTILAPTPAITETSLLDNTSDQVTLGSLDTRDSGESIHQSDSDDSDLDDDGESLPGSPPDMTELDSDEVEAKNAGIDEKLKASYEALHHELLERKQDGEIDDEGEEMMKTIEDRYDLVSSNDELTSIPESDTTLGPISSGVYFESPPLSTQDQTRQAHFVPDFDTPSVLPTAATTITDTTPPSRGLSPPLPSSMSTLESTLPSETRNTSEESFKQRLAAISEGTSVPRSDPLSPSENESLDDVRARLDDVDRIPSPVLDDTVQSATSLDRE